MSVNLKSYFYIYLALGNGELSILHSPNGINFKGNEPVKTSELPKIISTALGHTTQTVFNSLIIIYLTLMVNSYVMHDNIWRRL